MKKKANWYLAALKGESGFRLVRTFTEKDARSILADEGKITHFRQIPHAAGAAIAKEPLTMATSYSFELAPRALKATAEAVRKQYTITDKDSNRIVVVEAGSRKEAVEMYRAAHPKAVVEAGSRK